jgi:two-component system sensor histidine kinase BarA
MLARGISLADKSLLLFAAAVVAVVTLACGGLWWRVGAITDEAHASATRDFARYWSAENLRTPAALGQAHDSSFEDADGSAVRVRYVPWFQWDSDGAAAAAGGASGGGASGVVADAGAAFRAAARKKFDSVTPNARTPAEYAAVSNESKGRVCRQALVSFNEEGQRSGVVLIERRSGSGGLWFDRLFMSAGALVAGLLSFGAFYVILTRMILAPVRSLRETADLVRAGNVSTRSDIHTGDEFEELADAFNLMLTDLQTQQQQMRGQNKSLDLEITKLAERNLALYDSARLKGEFLARVSHELRTPMNAIIGFAELLQEAAESERADPGRSADPDRIARRQKYLTNILSSGRTLLEMINDLLAMARIEAGNIEVAVQEVNVGESCEGLLALIKPLADKKLVRLTLDVPGGTAGIGRGPDAGDAETPLPLVRTDPKKFEQIVFNFLSNAVKFTPEHGEVTLRCERLRGADGVGRVRVSVLDTGPGIPADQHAFVFERFTQIDGSRTREHQGTGLGLAIAKEFAELLQGEIQLVSEPGRGSMFSLIVPLTLDEAAAKEAASRIVGRVRERGRVGVA